MLFSQSVLLLHSPPAHVPPPRWVAAGVGAQRVMAAPDADPASARIAAEAAVSMTKKLLALEVPDPSDKAAYVKYHNTFSRYTAIKEEQAHLAKEELLVLWTDFIKPHHVEANPELHDIFWKAAKECSYVKVECSLLSGLGFVFLARWVLIWKLLREGSD